MTAMGTIENEEYFNFINSIKSDETRVQSSIRKQTEIIHGIL